MQTKIQINTLKFDALTSGNKDKPLVIFLHGFPETSYIWRDMIKDIANEGYYCIAPNMRGYSVNACPKGKKNYTLDKLAKDVLDIADWAGKEKFHLVGHDWGAIVGWFTVFHHRDRTLSWTALSVPHLKAMGKAIKTDEQQKKMSSYIKLFMIPFLPEYKLRKNNFEQLRKVWKFSSEGEVEEYLKVFKNKKCLTGALNYYRANFGLKRPEPIGNISTPTLFLWGEREKFIGRTAADLNENYMDGDCTFKNLDGGHWLVQTNYEDVKSELIKHLSKSSINN